MIDYLDCLALCYHFVGGGLYKSAIELFIQYFSSSTTTSPGWLESENDWLWFIKAARHDAGSAQSHGPKSELKIGRWPLCTSVHS